ncbi:hypothetical protein [Dankookia sp. P2]|uniref:hypothetical protein n=1 Tax=Dankookia sp. P2 TaxID=3423955 RepID=UPI003D668D98
MPSAVNKESVNDRAKLLMHRLIARRLAQDPALVEQARGLVRRRLAEGAALDCAAEWDRLLGRGPADVRRAIVSRNAKMTRFRLSSPLPSLVGFQDEALRRRIWRKAKLTLAGPVETMSLI